MVGGEGDDRFWGGIGDATAGLTDGLDTADYSASAAGITITFDGTDTTPALTVADGTGGTDTLHSIEKIVATGYTDYLYYNGEIPDDYAPDGSHKLTIDMGTDTGDVVLNARDAETSIHSYIDGQGTGTLKGDGPGVIKLLNAKTQIIGSDYDDEITDLAVHDGLKRIDGGWGNDVITVDGSDAMISGGRGNDTITGGGGNDLLTGGEGFDIVHGGDGSDYLTNFRPQDVTGTYYDHDELNGDDGHDYLKIVADSGGATLSGGGGNDVLDVRGASTVHVRLDGDAGHDMLLLDEVSQVSLDGLTYDDITFVWDVSFQTQTELTGDLVIRVDATGATLFVADVTAVIYPEVEPSPYYDVSFYLPIEIDGGYIGGRIDEKVVLGPVAQYATAPDDYENAVTPDPQDVQGTPDNDDLRGSQGDDTISGGDGEDSFHSSGGTDEIDGGAGEDRLSLFGAREDFSIDRDGSGIVTVGDRNGLEGILVLTSVEKFYFTADNIEYSIEDLFGYYGTSGNDTIVASTVDNELYGLAGNDILHGLDGSDFIDGGEGDDTAHFAGLSGDYRIFRQTDGAIAVVGANEGDGYEAQDTLVDVEALHFAGDSVTLDVDDIPPLGTALDDDIAGSDRPDQLYGGDGNDILSGLDGDDSLIGEAGNDVLRGGAGRDFLTGGSGNDRYESGAGDDWTSDSGGDDTYVYNLGDEEDSISDALGFDILEFGSGIAPSDVIVTADGDNYVLSFASTSGSVTIWDGGTEDQAIDEVRFADSTIWTAQDLYDMAFGQQLTGGGEETMSWQSSEPAFTPARFAYMADFHCHVP